MGEVVGKAAWICVRHHTTPRGVYEQYLDILKDLMNQPGAMRRDSLEAALYLPANAKKLPEVASDGLDPKKMEGIVIDVKILTRKGARPKSKPEQQQEQEQKLLETKPL